MAKVIDLEGARDRRSQGRVQLQARIAGKFGVAANADYVAANSVAWECSKREIAVSLISRAVDLLSDIGQRERRVGWILEDCVDLLHERAE